MQPELLYRLQGVPDGAIPYKNATGINAAIAEQLEDKDLASWNESLHVVQNLGIDNDLVESLLMRAFGWSSQAYWQGSKTDEVPVPEEVYFCHKNSK